MMTPKFHRPFSPTIMESVVPDKFVEIVNEEGFVEGGGGGGL